MSTDRCRVCAQTQVDAKKWTRLRDGICPQCRGKFHAIDYKAVDTRGIRADMIRSGVPVLVRVVRT